MAGVGENQIRLISGYPGISSAHMAVVGNYANPILLGPPICDELVALIMHMYSEEEADVMQYIKPWRVRSAKGLAKQCGRPLEEVKRILQRLAYEKSTLITFTIGNEDRYLMLPIFPGTFDIMFIGAEPREMTPWHQRSAELFEDLFYTGFLNEYVGKSPVDAVRVLPIGEEIEGTQIALPSDRLEIALDKFEVFGLATCCCRQAKRLAGGDCTKDLETCVVMGGLAELFIKQGRFRAISKKDVIEIKAKAESDGMVTWFKNQDGGKFGNVACSCCSCCCGIMRTISQFNVPGLVAPPHFIPVIDAVKCTLCGKCIDACPVSAIMRTEDGGDRRLVFKQTHCIGCGLCLRACPNRARTLQEVPGYKEPPTGWLSYFRKYWFNYASDMLRVGSSRRDKVSSGSFTRRDG
jgi:formate hydrogenlyase subunit 6/NADH:ubiquinone oxidoreductase subunit I